MLEKVNLDLKLSKQEYKQVLPDLQRRLYDLEKACWDQRIPSIVLFSGWDAAGKGSAIATLTERLDPRGFKLSKTQAPRTYEQQRPWLWRFWLKIPAYGEMAIFDLGWYQRVVTERVEKLVSKKEWRRAYRDIVEFEHMLADDGIVIVTNLYSSYAVSYTCCLSQELGASKSLSPTIVVFQPHVSQSSSANVWPTSCAARCVKYPRGVRSDRSLLARSIQYVSS